MGSMLTSKIGVLGLATFVLAVMGTRAEAILQNLTDTQIREAVEHGQKHFDQHPVAFMQDYYYDAGYGYPNALLRTEYFAVADFIRRSEFQRKYGSQRVHQNTPDRIEDQRKEVAGKLQFLVTVYGEKENFPKDYSFALVVNGKKIAPSGADAPVKGESSGFRGKLAYTAKVIVEFPTAGIDPAGTVALEVVPPKGLGPSGSRHDSYELPFNLARIK